MFLVWSNNYSLVRASLAFLVLWSFSIFKKAVCKRWELTAMFWLWIRKWLHSSGNAENHSSLYKLWTQGLAVMSPSGLLPSHFLSSISSSTHRGPFPTSWWFDFLIIVKEFDFPLVVFFKSMLLTFKPSSCRHWCQCCSVSLVGWEICTQDFYSQPLLPSSYSGRWEFLCA